MLPSIEKIAEMLGGEVTGGQVLAPGPGHDAGDRSLSVKLDDKAPDGFVAHSFAGDDWKACRDYVRKRLGLPAFGNGQGGGARKLIREHVYYTADGKPLVCKRKMLDSDGKRQFPQQHWNGQQWVNGIPKDWPRVLYRLRELRAAPVTSTIYVTEGEGDADALAAIGLMSTTAGGVSSKWTPEMIEHLRDRPVVIFADSDKPGREYAQTVAGLLDPVAKSIKVVDLFPTRSDGSDVSNFLESDRAGIKLLDAVRAAPFWEPPKAGDGKHDGGGSDDQLVAELAALPKLEYERRREQAAEELGVRVSVLDKLVEAARDEAQTDTSSDDGKQGRPVSFPEVQPWPEPVDGSQLLNALAYAIGRHVVMRKQGRHATAAWVVHTYLLDCFQISPRLALRSPVMQCGKSTLLDILSCLVCRALPTANVTPSVLFRVVEKHRPCLCVDEGDTFLPENDELRGIINSGHRKGGQVLRSVGDEFEPRAFATYSALAIAAIGNLPGTIADRSVVIDLKRRLRNERITSFSLDDTGHLTMLARRVARWAADNEVAVGAAAANPTMPDAIINRRRDNWKPLFAIAQVAGGRWPQRIEAAALKAGATGDDDEASLVELLLGDIKDIFDRRAANEVDPTDRISSGDLVDALVGMEARPWGELGKNQKKLTQNRLARLLKPLKIVPETVRISEKRTAKGYYLHQFTEAFARYLGSDGASEPSQRNKADETGTSDPFESVTAETDVTVRKCEKSANDGPCYGVTVEKGTSGETGDEEVLQSSFEVLGPALDGERCSLCGASGITGSGGRPVRIKHRDGIDPWHEDCARRYFAALADPPVKVPPDGRSEDRTCAQCGLADGSEELVTVGDRAVWLHRECGRFFRGQP